MQVAAATTPASGPLKRFPPVIERALALLAGSDHGTLSALNMGERLLLARYVRCADALDPSGPIRVSIRVLADGLRVSARTVNTLKAALLANGWISSHQVQSRRRGMQICDVRLTPHAIQVLQLLDTLRRPTTDPEAKGAVADRAERCDREVPAARSLAKHRCDAGCSRRDSTGANLRGSPLPCGQLQSPAEPPATSTAALCADAARACRDFKKQPIQGHPAREGLDQGRLSAPRGSALPAWQRHRSPRLPRPLAWLEQHMSGTRVCLLMREAREHGVELETLATATRARIDRVRHPFAYLRTLVRAKPATRPARHLEPRQDTEMRNRVQQWGLQAQGLAFSSSAGLIHRVEAGVVRVYAPEEAVKPLGNSVGVMPLSARFIDDVSQGTLRPWRPAVSATESIASTRGQ